MSPTEVYDADARMEELGKDRPEFKIGGVFYVAGLPTLDDQAEIAKLLPDGQATDSQELERQVDSIRTQMKRFLGRRDAAGGRGKAKVGDPPPDAALGKLAPKVCGEILAKINRDEEDEPGN